MKNSKPLPRNTLQTMKQQIARFEIYFPRTRYWLIGGGLLFLLMLLLLAGCSPQVITRCGADRSLLEPIPLPVKPEKPTNGDLATSHRNLLVAISMDNERKDRLAKQLSECQ